MTREEYKKEYDRMYKSTHRELLRDKERKRRENDPMKEKEKCKRYYQRNRERIKLAYTLGVPIGSIAK